MILTHPQNNSSNNTDITSPAHADDLAVMALFQKSLNKLLEIAYDYSIKWFFSFSMEKSIVLTWNANSDLGSIEQLKLGPGVLKVKK